MLHFLSLKRDYETLGQFLITNVQKNNIQLNAMSTDLYFLVELL